MTQHSYHQTFLARYIEYIQLCNIMNKLIYIFNTAGLQVATGCLES